MTLRKPSKILRSMSDMLEVASMERLNPVCFEKFEPEDVSYHRCIHTYIHRYIHTYIHIALYIICRLYVMFSFIFI